MRSWVVRLVVLAIILAWAETASAHPSPPSNVTIDFSVDGATIDADVPLDELELAQKHELWDPARGLDAVAADHRMELDDYARAHVALRDGGGSWAIRRVDTSAFLASDGPRVRFHVEADSPARHRGDVTLDDDMVVHEVKSHVALVHVRSDWEDGATEDHVAGTLRSSSTSLRLPRHGSFVRGLGSVVRAGFDHVLDGSDHVLFIALLAISAPWAVRAGRYHGPKPLRAALRSAAGLATAFTVGHSLTLALAALHVVSAPSTIVEPLVALSVVATGVHAIRPLHARAELAMAGGFGLVHGLAFATAITGASRSTTQTAWTIVGFNAGVELAQIALLALVLPWAMVAARSQAGERLRAAWAGLGIAVATGWFVVRVGVPLPHLADAIAWIEGHEVHLLGTLAASAITAWARTPLTARTTSRSTSARPTRAWGAMGRP